MVEEYGGEVRTAVSGNLDYLIAGESAGSKREKAQSL
jgi:NAD-dependent DNA ligase